MKQFVRNISMVMWSTVWLLGACGEEKSSAMATSGTIAPQEIYHARLSNDSAQQYDGTITVERLRDCIGDYCGVVHSGSDTSVSRCTKFSGVMMTDADPGNCFSNSRRPLPLLRRPDLTSTAVTFFCHS